MKERSEIDIRPIVYNINAFDGRGDKTIEFSWSGNQAVKNICTIYNNTTGVQVYQNTMTTMSLKHVIPAGSLANGILYQLIIQTIDSNNAVSETSAPVLFHCYTAPILSITNIIPNATIANSFYEVQLGYSQQEGEQLQEYQLILYNMNKSPIWRSAIKYDNSNLKISLFDLQDDTQYYIRATGTTVEGIKVNTDFIPFSVNYIMPSVYALVSLENIFDTGSVKIHSNIISIEGRYSSGTPTYIDNDYVDLYNSPQSVFFDKDFSLTGNFLLNIKGYNFKDEVNLLILSDGINIISLKKRSDQTSQIYFELNVPGGLEPYVIRSNFISTPNSSDVISVWIKKVGTLYSVTAQKII